MKSEGAFAARMERRFLLGGALAGLCGVAAVALARGAAVAGPAAVMALWLAALWAAQTGLRRAGLRGDPYLLPLAVLLTGVGLTMVYRLKPDLFAHQLAWAAVGLAAYIAAAFFFRRCEALAGYKYVFGLLGIALLLTAILFGTEIGGNKNWVVLGPLRFQPSEFAKLFMIFFLAAYLGERRELLALRTSRLGFLSLPPLRFIAPLLTLWGVAMLIFVLQRDLGAALLFFGVALAMIYMASGAFSYVGGGAVLFSAGAAACRLLFPHVRTRVDIWLHPWDDPTGKSYQIVQSLFALGSGGVWGSGLAHGYPGMIPEVHTDFMFAAIGEELGLAGAAAVLSAYILLIYRAFYIAVRRRRPFGALTAAGLGAALALQVFIIVGGVTNFTPLTGVTLPFVSYGGSSMVANYIALGLLLALSETEDGRG